MESMTEDDFGKLEEAIGMLDLVASLNGIGPNDWVPDVCKDMLADIARRASTPFCSSSCQPLGFCDSDCLSTVATCGRMAEYAVLAPVLPGGPYFGILSGVVGPGIANCVGDLLNYVSGGGDASQICKSDNANHDFPLMAFGSVHGLDCMLLYSDPQEMLRGGSGSGECALNRWDEHVAEIDAVNQHNADLIAGALVEEEVEEEEEEEAEEEYPPWRRIALPGIVLAAYALIFLGHKMSTKEKKKGQDMSAVAPVLDAKSTRSQRGSTEIETPWIRVSDTHTFVQLFGGTGVFVSVAMAMCGMLAMCVARAQKEGVVAAGAAAADHVSSPSPLLSPLLLRSPLRTQVAWVQSRG
jgi:hypothetical protein